MSFKRISILSFEKTDFVKQISDNLEKHNTVDSLKYKIDFVSKDLLYFDNELAYRLSHSDALIMNLRLDPADRSLSTILLHMELFQNLIKQVRVFGQQLIFIIGMPSRPATKTEKFLWDAATYYTELYNREYSGNNIMCLGQHSTIENIDLESFIDDH